MGNIAIITARGGSKRIPNKNIKEFCGRPIIEYSIEAALKSEIFNEVMVSTDSDKIAEIAMAAGAKVPFRRNEKTSNDYATTADVIIEVIDSYEKLGRNFINIACLYPTAPFVTSKKLQEGMKLLQEKKAGMVMPVVRYSFPPQRGMIQKDGFLEYRWPENRNTRSQDLEQIYHDCGQFYFYDKETFVKLKGQFVDNIVPMVMSESEVQDIDTIDDWIMAELKYRLIKEREA